MDKESASASLQKYLEENPNQAPTESFKLGEPQEFTVNNEKLYLVCWVDSEGHNARGGYQYYIMPGGSVILPGGGSISPESPEDVYKRWQTIK